VSLSVHTMRVLHALQTCHAMWCCERQNFAAYQHQRFICSNMLSLWTLLLASGIRAAAFAHRSSS
jgi:hypothetical protein